MSYTYETLVEVQCYKCGIRFGLIQSYYDLRKRDKKEWYCPNGHTQYFIGETAEQRLRRELRAEEAKHRKTKQTLKTQQTRTANYREDNDAKDRQMISLRGTITMLRRYMKDGKCPCCHKTVDDLPGHLKEKHPHFMAPVQPKKEKECQNQNKNE